jgi:outer membrane protein OmpA-like peptidoglycan-associated protein
MTGARRRRTPWMTIGATVLLGVGACATPPKPAALTAYEDLLRNPNMEQTRQHYPDLVASAQRFGEKADKDWQSNNIDDSTRAATMAEIKLKTALARYDQQAAKDRLQSLATEQARADETQASVDKDLNGLNEQIKFMQKSADAEAEKKRLTEEITAEQKRAEDERQKLNQQLDTEKKRAAAQIALRTAETVDAAKYAAADYGAATSMMAKADAEMKQGNWGAAQASLEVARTNAEQAIAIAKPSYEQAEQATQSKARDEALARDAAGLPGFAVRIERQGELQRLIISIQDLFGRSQTTLAAGKDSVLDPIARLISKYPSYPVQVVGHTDNKGKPGELIALSQARAQSVFSSLVARGVEARRLMVSGQGPNEPVADNKVASGRAKNTRIEIIFLYH